MIQSWNEAAIFNPSGSRRLTDAKMTKTIRYHLCNLYLGELSLLNAKLSVETIDSLRSAGAEIHVFGWIAPLVLEHGLGMNLEDNSFDEGLLAGDIQVRKNIHLGWNEVNNAVLQGADPRMFQTFGKWHYNYYSKKGHISLIELDMAWFGRQHFWEIYSFDKLFDDVERFSTKAQAERRILELML